MLHPSLLQVIYALNTKNDEHEAAIATLKEAHEEEVQQILSETREKILQVYTAYPLFLFTTKKLLSHFKILSQSFSSESIPCTWMKNARKVYFLHLHMHLK